MIASNAKKSLPPLTALIVLVMMAVLVPLVAGPSQADAAALGKRRHEQPTQRNLQIKNKSGVRVDALWINRFANPVTFHSNSNDEGTPYGGEQNILSYIGHEFELRELPSKKSGKCKFETCRKTQIKVNGQEDQVVILDKNFIATHTDRWRDAQIEAKELVSRCRAATLPNHGDGEGYDVTSEKVEALAGCIHQSLNATLVTKQEEHDFQSSLRATMADKFVPYACNTPRLNMSDEVMNQTWKYKDASSLYRTKTTTYQLKVYHDRPYSQIFAIDEFITPEECQALSEMEVRSKPHDANNKHMLSWKEVLGNAILSELMKRIYDLGKMALEWDGLSMKAASTAPGNEVALEFNRDEGAGNGDENEMCPPYSPFCNIKETKKTTIHEPRDLSHVFMFCDKEPKENGGIHFPQAAVHVHPKHGRLVWAEIQGSDDVGNPDLAIVSDGFVQEYHFCPNHTIYTHRLVIPSSN